MTHELLSDVWLRLLLATFASYRVTHLFAREDGPFDIMYRFRKQLGTGFFGSLFDCFKCISAWVAAPFAYFVTSNDIPSWCVTWFAISGAVCWLDAVTRRDATESAPVVIERVIQPEEVQSELLWTEAKSIKAEQRARSGSPAAD
ncbi:MAG: hypothetical protein ACOY0T_35145 [Myxococcota bacterium]